MKKTCHVKVSYTILRFIFLTLVVLPGPYRALCGTGAENDVDRQGGIVVSGIVSDTDGVPMPGVAVTIPGTTTGVQTDVNGRYTITVPSVSTTLIFSFLGFASHEVVVGNSTVIDVTLGEDTTVLDEVVIIGFGSQRKATVTGSISSVTTKDLLQSPQANVSNALAGRMPGIMAVQMSGEPGNDQSTLRIRGVGTFAEGQDPLIMVDGIESATYNNIDPNEIESITILKDASATAVYGVRGANGVLLITTKRGVIGAPKVSPSTNVALSNFEFLRKNMNSYDYATAYNMAQGYDSYVTGNYNPKYTAEEIEKYRTGSDPIFYPSVDWYDYMLRKNTLQSQTNLNISGGTERVKYFFSLGYFTQNGVLDTKVFDSGYDNEIKYRRYNLRSNFDIKITKRLNASFDLSTQIDDKRRPNWDTELLFQMLSSTPPNVSPGVVDGKVVTINNVTNSSWNPMIVYQKGWYREYGNTLDGTVRLNYDLDYVTKGFSLRGAVSYKNYNLDKKLYEDMSGITYEARRTEDGGIVYIPSGDEAVMRYGDEVDKHRRIYLEYGAQYDRTFGDHTFTALVLYNQSKYHSPALAYLVPNGYQGLVGRATYNYANRYLAEFNIGYNGTEDFAKGKRFGFFPAYSLGWVASEEGFYPANDIVPYLKVRGSYGIVGNDRIGGERFLFRPTTYNYSDEMYWFGEVGSNYQAWQGANEGKLGNPLLTWEKAKKLNIGADIRFWKSKLSLTGDYFVEKRNNILWNRGTVPDIFGAEMPAYNLGWMKNSGFDGEIAYNDMFGQVYFFAKANYTYAHNKIVYQDEVSWQYPYQYRTGHRYGQYFGYVADGLFNSWEEVNDANRPTYTWNNNRIQPGDVKYKDINGDGVIDTNDMVPIGYSNFPEIMWGFSLGGAFKGFDLSLLFQGAARVSRYPSRQTMRGFYTDTGAHKGLLKSWSQERYDSGQEILYPRYSITNDDHNYLISTYWLEDASYVRLKNAEIGYTFDTRLLKKIGISSLRIYMNGNNLLTWCKLFPGEDPESYGGDWTSEPYPVMRTFNLGININF